MKDLFRNAANKIANGELCFACNAIPHYRSKERKIFEYYFEQPEEDIDGGWFGDTRIPENQLARAIALDLMAEIVKDLK